MSLGQTYSMDAVIATAIFVVALMFFLALSFDDSEQQKIDRLNDQVNILVQAVAAQKNLTGGAVISGARVNPETLDVLSTMSYQQLKDVFGVSADFCIHFEDTEGNVVNVSGRKTGLGSGLVRVGGVACNATLN